MIQTRMTSDLNVLFLDMCEKGHLLVRPLSLSLSHTHTLYAKVLSLSHSLSHTHTFSLKMVRYLVEKKEVIPSLVRGRTTKGFEFLFTVFFKIFSLLSCSQIFTVVSLSF